MCSPKVIWLAIGLVWGLFWIGSATNAYEVDSIEEADRAISRELYCGLYCIHSAMSSLGVDVPFESLLLPENVGQHGSSMETLDRIAREHGLESKIVNGWTTSMLLNTTCPMILHFKPEQDGIRYRHWVLYMGSDGGLARIYDGPRKIDMRLSELASRWDGVALSVSKQPESHAIARLGFVVDFCFYVAVGVFAYALMQRVVVGIPSLRTAPLTQIIALLLLSGLAGAIYRLTSYSGYLVHSRLIATIQDLHWSSFLPKMTAKEVERVVDSNDHVIVDARLESDFRLEHIRGAINLSPKHNKDELKRAMEGVPKDRSIVVYCQMEGCSYSNVVARRLFELGYSNVSIFKGGWQEWQDKIQRKEKST